MIFFFLFVYSNFNPFFLTLRFKDFLFTHWKSCHLGLRLLSCPFCDDSFFKESRLIQHMESGHFGRRIFDVESGSSTSKPPSYSSSSSSSVMGVGGVAQISLPEDDCQCSVCEFRMDSSLSSSSLKGELERHFESEHIEPLIEQHLVCRECGVKVLNGIQSRHFLTFKKRS